MTEEKVLNNMISIFKKGIKDEANKLGVEFEHFIIDKNSLMSCDYESGVNKVMVNLVKKGWQPLNPESKEILGLMKNGHSITLEPGGQIELSLKPYVKIQAIKKAYEEILNEIKASLLSNQKIISLGYHPKSKINTLEILPKVRYHQMFEYFKTCGEYAHYMMKGTASTQVTIDYNSEEDFIKKFRVANFLSPFIYRIFDASPIFEGALYNKHNLRLKIWDNTDQRRCGIPNQALTNLNFGFKDYGQYILESPPIFLKKENEYIFTGNEKLKDLVKDVKNDQVDLEQVLGMVFPDARLKGCLELRMPDALPYPFNMAVPALVKGIFYNPSVLEKYYERSLDFNDSDFHKFKEMLKENMDIEYKGIDTKILINEIFEDAINGLSEEESLELIQLKKIIDSYGSMSNLLKNLYETKTSDFLSLISGGQ